MLTGTCRIGNRERNLPGLCRDRISKQELAASLFSADSAIQKGRVTAHNFATVLTHTGKSGACPLFEYLRLSARQSSEMEVVSQRRYKV